MPDPMMTPLPAGADLGFWTSEVSRSQDQRRVYEGNWQENIDAYEGKPPKDRAPDSVNVNVDFYQVEQKLAQLFYQTPELQITSKPPMQGQDTILQLHRTVLNEQLGPDFIDVIQTVLRAVKDCLCPSGVGPTIIGYQPTTVDVPAPDGYGDPLAPPMIPVPIHERWYWTRFSPKKLLIPSEFKDTDWDAAPWLGMEFRMPLPMARREFDLPPTFVGTTARDEKTFDGDRSQEDVSGLAYVEGQVIWYRAACYEHTVVSPELYRELVLVDGLDTPARHRDSPYQRFVQNRLTGDSMVGNPIHPLSIRFIPDSAYTPSDSQMTRPLVKELCTFRTQMKRERDANRQRVGYDSEKLTPETIAKIASGDVGDLIALEGGALAQGVGTIMAPLITGISTRQTYEQNDYFQRDINKTLALDASQVGAKDDSARTATEINVVDRSASVRLDAERNQVIRWYLKGISCKLSPLLLRFLPNSPVLVNMLGEQGAQAWTAWAQSLMSSRMSYSIRPDSQVRLDAASERKFRLSLYQMTAQDPNVIRVELLKELFASAGYDPQRLIVDKLPEQTPEPNISFRFAGEDLYNPMVREILAQGGIQVSQEAVDEAAQQLLVQTTLGLRDASGKAVPYQPRPQVHGGPAEEVRPLTQQQGDITKARPQMPPQDQ